LLQKSELARRVNSKKYFFKEESLFRSKILENNHELMEYTDYLEKLVDRRPLVPITIDKAFKKLSEVMPDISIRKICSFIVQSKLKPLIRYEGILDEHYFYTWHLQAVLSGNYSHDDIDEFSPDTIAINSKMFNGFLAPQNKDLFAKLLTENNSEKCIKFKISITQESDLYLGDIDDEYIHAHMDVLNTIENHRSISFSHVQLRGNTVYGYVDLEKGVELEATDFVFLERDVDSLCSEIKQNQANFEPNENTLVLKQPTSEKPKVLRMDATREVLVNLIKENPDITKLEVWDRIKTMAANEEYPFKTTRHSDTVSFMVGSQSKLALDDDYKNITKRSVERRFASLKEKLSTKNPDKTE
jgi:hypothetical protein